MIGHNEPQPVSICHVAHGDLWAGAEVQLTTLMEGLISSRQFAVRVVLLNEGRLAEELRRLGACVTVLSEQNHSSAYLLFKLFRYLKRHRPCVVHTHKYKDNILGSIAAMAAGGSVIVRTVHGMTEPFTGQAYVRMTVYETLDKAVTSLKVKKIIAVSSDIASSLSRIYGREKVVHIHNGINLDQIVVTRERPTTRAEFGIGAEEFVVGTVGRLTPVKGHEFLLRSVGLVKDQIGHLKCLIVGDGPLLQQLRRLAKDLGLEKKVILAGQRHDVYDLINSMDLFVLPSLHEGIPMVLLEALALQRPVVASRVGGMPEVISHGTSGILVEAGNIEELKDAMLRVANNRSYAEALGKAGRVRVEEEFTARLMVKRTADLYSSLVACH